MRTIVIWGAGRIGRGFVNGIFHADGWRTVFVDIDKTLVERLNAAGRYTVYKAKHTGIETTVIDGGFTAIHTSETEKLEKLFEEDELLLDIAVHAPKLPEVADMTAPLLKHRLLGCGKMMDIMMNVNMTSPDERYISLIKERFTEAEFELFREKVGVTGIAAACISPMASEEELKKDPLTLINNGYPEQAIGRALLKCTPPILKGLRLCSDVHAEESRKLYTLNMAHAMSCYLGVKRGYQTVMDVVKDEELFSLVCTALSEAQTGIDAAFDFAKEENDIWVGRVKELLLNPYINDDLPRLGADTRRKLSHTDRLCMPALLCLKAGRQPVSIAPAIRAGFDFEHDDEGTIAVRNLVKAQGIEAAVKQISSLSENDALYRLIV